MISFYIPFFVCNDVGTMCKFWHGWWTVSKLNCQLPSEFSCGLLTETGWL